MPIKMERYREKQVITTKSRRVLVIFSEKEKEREEWVPEGTSKVLAMLAFLI